MPETDPPGPCMIGTRPAAARTVHAAERNTSGRPVTMFPLVPLNIWPAARARQSILLTAVPIEFAGTGAPAMPVRHVRHLGMYIMLHTLMLGPPPLVENYRASNAQLHDARKARAHTCCRQSQRSLCNSQAPPAPACVSNAYRTLVACTGIEPATIKNVHEGRIQEMLDAKEKGTALHRGRAARADYVDRAGN